MIWTIHHYDIMIWYVLHNWPFFNGTQGSPVDSTDKVLVIQKCDILLQMNLTRRQGRNGNDLKGMAWDEMALVPVVTTSIVFTALEVYSNRYRCGARDIELYIGISKPHLSHISLFHVKVIIAIIAFIFIVFAMILKTLMLLQATVTLPIIAAVTAIGQV